VLGLPAPVATERRKKKSAGFDIAGALEANLDRYPKKEDLWQLLTEWLDAAQREKLGERFPDYVKALPACNHGGVESVKQHAIEPLQAR
jgi:hypothetical protein